MAKGVDLFFGAAVPRYVMSKGGKREEGDFGEVVVRWARAPYALLIGLIMVQQVTHYLSTSMHR
jgi:hypothetical protein